MLLAVPNLSEGRDVALVREIADVPGLLDVHSDPDHNRSVLTYGGDAARLKRSCLAMIVRAVERLDISRHEGVHPRWGVVDVLPIVHLGPVSHEAENLATDLAEQLERTGLPVFRYARDDLPAVRRQVAASSRRHPTAGAVCIGVRPPLIAFNVNLRGSLDEARRVANEVRRALPAVRTLAFALGSRGLVQVSMNLVDPDRTGPRTAFEAVRSRAAGLEVVEAEVVGLVPGSVLDQLSELPIAGSVRSIEEALG